MQRKIPCLPEEVVEKFLNPLEQKIYYMLLEAQKKKESKKHILTTHSKP